jgi:hypothetical protein
MRNKYQSLAHHKNGGLGDKVINDFHFVERLHYGCIDHENTSVVPDQRYLVDINGGRVFDFVADSFALMRLNMEQALQRNLISQRGFELANLNIKMSYEDPKLKYGEYLGDILQLYNETHIPIVLGNNSIASYNDYVNHFFKFILNQPKDVPITMTRWMTSNKSSILDTGLGIMLEDMGYDDDQTKINNIIDHPCFGYFKNISLNMGFSISHQNPNIIVGDLSSPATETIRYSYGLFNLKDIFSKRYIKTNTIDINILYDIINIYYNKYVLKNPQTRIVMRKCGKTVSEFVQRENIQTDIRPHTPLQEIYFYAQIRNLEDGMPFDPDRMGHIHSKAKYLLKNVDKPSAISYIDNIFRDQLWNKNGGFHDLKRRIFQNSGTSTEAQRQQTGGGPSSSGSSY